MLIPKALAYYLGTHFCGSQVMYENIADTKQAVRHVIREALGIGKD